MQISVGHETSQPLSLMIIKTLLLSELKEFKIPSETGTPCLYVFAMCCNMEPMFVNTSLGLELVASQRSVFCTVQYVQRVDSRYSYVRFSSLVCFQRLSVLSTSWKIQKSEAKVSSLHHKCRFCFLYDGYSIRRERANWLN